MRSLLFPLLLLLGGQTIAAEKVQYALTAYVAGTNTIATAFRVGQEFDLALSVNDLRPRGSWFTSTGIKKALVRGVFAAYCDMAFDSSLADISTVRFSPTYPNGVQFAMNPGFVNDSGAFASSFAGLGTAAQEVFRLRVKCKAAGKLTFTPGFDVAHPQRDTLVYGNDAADPPEPSYVAAEEIRIVPAVITIR